MSNVQVILRTMRPAFLLLTLSCVLLGIASAHQLGAEIGLVDAVLVLLGALAAHVSVNMFNEYHDFRSGLDAQTQRTPFSGGSGALVATPGVASQVRGGAVMALALVVLIGGYFTLTLGMGLLVMGALGVIIVVTYTPWINRHPKLCLITPGLAFGPLMVMGTDYVFTQNFSLLSFVLSMVPFFLANNLLLLNQYPDLEADRTVGRFHFPIAYGTKRASVVYAVFIFGALYSLGMAVAIGIVPNLAMWAMVPMVSAIYAVVGGFKYGTRIGGHLAFLRANVLAAVLSPLVLAIAILLA